MLTKQSQPQTVTAVNCITLSKLLSGASVPQQPWRSPQILTYPPFSATPTPWPFYMQFSANFMCVFSEFWKLAIMDNDTKNIG